jgi:hypothetical protein
MKRRIKPKNKDWNTAGIKGHAVIIKVNYSRTSDETINLYSSTLGSLCH